MKHRMIDEAEQEVTRRKEAYLREWGWEHTCNTPGSYWLWRRDFSKEDAECHARWKARPAGPLGKSSKPQPFGIITAALDLAVSMTALSLDNMPEQNECQDEAYSDMD